MRVNEQDILTQLAQITFDDTAGGNTRDIVSSGMVSDIYLNDGAVMFSISVPAAQAQAFEPVRQRAEEVVAAMRGVDRAIVTLTAERKPDAAREPPAPRRLPQPAPVPGVKAIIAVASGKGGVGKSTTAVNLAVGLQRLGMQAGILDADIYGPSIPRLLGLNARPQTRDNVLIPMDGFGLKAMSIGFLIAEDTPVIWRGPMVIKALAQLLHDVDWQPLDVLVVDMPPGTGDTQLSLAQKVPVSGAIIVSTPQDLALIDARKGLNMFRQVDVPILGLVENMSTFVCPACGTQTEIFGAGGARREAKRLDVPFLGAVPLHMNIRATSDAGTPITVSDPRSVQAQSYFTIAEHVQARLRENERVTR